MSLEDLGITGLEEKVLLVDGDIIVYQPCCIFNDDDDQSKRQIAKHISNKLDKIMEAASCNRYMFFLTTKFNFRDQLVDDYKANRADVERPVNLAWAKRYVVETLNAYFVKGLEADDLLGIYNKEGSIIWSLDKDLRQIPGEHLDDATQKVITVNQEGRLEEISWVTESGTPKSKIYFEGDIGLYFQMLTGDSTDNILGCAKRVTKVRKSGKDKGLEYTARDGIGPKAAMKSILSSIMHKGNRSNSEAALDAVIGEYKKIHGNNWQTELETQANLLFMVRQMRGNIFRRWTYDGRKEYFDLDKGIVISEEVFINDYQS